MFSQDYGHDDEASADKQGELFSRLMLRPVVLTKTQSRRHGKDDWIKSAWIMLNHPVDLVSEDDLLV